MSNQTQSSEQDLAFEEFRLEVLSDFKLANESRQASLLGRKEVLTGKAKFGIFGDGKEVPQIALAKQFQNGDFRAGYYRDQTFMMAIGELTLQQFFAQLYAHADVEHDPASAGRLMNGHFGSRLLNEDGSWKSQTASKNSSSDISTTSGQMPRLLGLAWASKLYRNNPALHTLKDFSINGNEVAFGTIGDASTSEGHFFETINAAGVLQVPMAISVWDDGYGISVPQKFQTTKESISEILKGFETDGPGRGILIYKVKGWNYAELCQAYEEGIAKARENHMPVLFHIQELTQPQGHSTSGSHERYKNADRLQWEQEFDCIKKMREWILENAIADAAELDQIEENAKKLARTAQKQAWEEFCKPIKSELNEAVVLLDNLAAASFDSAPIAKLAAELKSTVDPIRKDIAVALRKALRNLRNEHNPAKVELKAWLSKFKDENAERYNTYLYSHSAEAASTIRAVAPVYSENSQLVDGREVLQANFDYIFTNNPKVVAFGEDVGKIGDVNQAFSGLQDKFGEVRISDTGIRECTIMGQGIGLAIRGLRPIAEIQYLDYLLFAITSMSDDLSTILYRTKGGQKAPVIVRTRGHRLEGIWHSGSPMQVLLGALRGMHILTPRNMVQAAGFYNTMLASDEPCLIIEPLNGYRIKEQMPDNIGEFRVPVGVPEVITAGTDITLVTYGSSVRIAQDALVQLQELGISVELIDVQSLLPFDVNAMISESIKKTNKVLFMDEDVPGGATAYMMQQVLEGQEAYQYLDSTPRTLSAKAHRPPYGSDGDYFSKPSVEDVVECIYEMMSEYAPNRFPAL